MTGPEIVVDTVRLRGSHAGRLARVAARALPTALERALADLEDVQVASMEVVLDLDPDEYDDETLAVLWADLIRAGLVADGARSRSEAAAAAAAVGEPAAPSAPVEDLLLVVRSWLRLEPAARPSIPAALLALGDPARADRVALALGTDDWRRLVVALRTTLGARAVPATDRTAADRAPEDESSAPGRHPSTPRADVGYTTDAPVSAGVAGGVDDVPAPEAAGDDAGGGRLLHVLHTLGELHSGGLTPLDPATITRAAGLVLLYPWLADHCRSAEELHPGIDQYDVREAALAAVVGDPAAVDDPLVRLLAGRPEPWPEEARARTALARQEDVDASAGRVLASFAALLPGFERSSSGFVRDAWVVRTGLLDTALSPVRLTAATHPLDVLLPLLPYPMGLLKLPWSPALTVRFRP